MKKSVKKIVVSMSGGVDSSVSAWILKKMGYKILGIFMKNWKFKKNEKCYIKKDIIDAIIISNNLKIKIKILNFYKEYKKKVFINFIKKYNKGYIPNPDVICNEKIKFNIFFKYIFKKYKIKYIATGHYAKIIKNILFKANDKNKDQSYFLYRLNKKKLFNIIFPLENIYKNTVRKIAKQLNFHNAKKKDSTGICFIGKKNFHNFLNKYIPYNPGIIKNFNNSIIDKHLGLNFYNIGQRKNLNIKNKNLFKKNIIINKPWYVAYKDYKNNILFITQNKYNSKLMFNIIKIKNINLILNFKNNILLSAKFKSNQIELPVFIKKKKNIIKIFFLKPQWAINKGQSLVFYKNDICLGGGIIYKCILKI